MGKSRPADAAPPGVAPGTTLPADQERERLLRKAEGAAAWAEELAASLEDHVAQVVARHNLRNHIGGVESTRVNAARQPVMEAMTRRIAGLIVDQRRRLVDEVKAYLDPSPEGYDALDELLFRYVPNNEYTVDTLATSASLAATLRSPYLQALRVLCSKLSPESAQNQEHAPVPFVHIQVGDDPNSVVGEARESFIEYGFEGSSRKRVSLSFQMAAILKILEEAPPPGVVTAGQVSAEAANRGWILNEVRWNRVRPKLEKELTSALQGLVGKTDRGEAFFDRAALARACQKLVS